MVIIEISFLEEDAPHRAKEREEKVDKEDPERKPSKPVVVWGERNLKLCKKIVIVLLGECSDDEDEEEESADHPCPPYQSVPKVYCHLHSG